MRDEFPEIARLCGLDPTLLGADEELLLRQAAHRWWRGVGAVKKKLQDQSCPTAEPIALARELVADLPSDEQPLTATSATARMCGWMAADGFRGLSRIAALDASDPGSRQEAEAVISRLTAPAGLRGLAVDRSSPSISIR